MHLHGIYVNKDVLKNEKSFAEYVKRSEDSWNTVMNNIDKLSGSQKELALVYQNAGRSLVDGNTVEGLFTHELGHHAQWTLLDAKTNNAVSSRMSEFAPKISGYANASKSEYLAESFTAYMKGERNILDPEYVRFIDSKAIDKGTKSGIIKEKENNALIINMQFFANKSIPKMESQQLSKAIKSWNEQIVIHKNKISSPEKYHENWDKLDERYKNGLKKHWEHEIKVFSNDIQEAIDELKKRGE